MGKTMKKMLILCILVFSPSLWAGCESTILEGSHVALKKADALAGAWEDAKEMCYPGEAEKLTRKCKKVGGEKGVQGKKAIQCRQEISCSICGEALRRKYEAQN